MSISTRTPEGLPNRCPICRKDVVIEPSLLFGDATCAHCGSLLWYLRTATGPRFYPYDQAEPIRERVIDTIAELLGVEREKVTGDLKSAADAIGADSLDVVELVMELEEEFGPEFFEDAESVDKLADVIRQDIGLKVKMKERGRSVKLLALLVIVAVFAAIVVGGLLLASASSDLQGLHTWGNN